MLREFLSKIFSPPKPYEEPRVQHDDFERLKRHIPSQNDHDEDEEKEICDIKHGSLSQQLPVQTPLSRSVSIGASSAAYERYLQRNAAKADNWAEFDELLHPTIEPYDPNAKSAQFLSPEEIEALSSLPLPKPRLVDPYLKAPPNLAPENKISPMLVHFVEMKITKNAQKLLKSSAGSRITIATLASFEKQKRTKISFELSQRILSAWMSVHASMSETPADALRAFAGSTIPKVRAAVASNERIPFDCMWALAQDREASVRFKLAKNPNCTIELLEVLSKDANPKVALGARKILSSITG